MVSNMLFNLVGQIFRSASQPRYFLICACIFSAAEAVAEPLVGGVCQWKEANIYDCSSMGIGSGLTINQIYEKGYRVVAPDTSFAIPATGGRPVVSKVVIIERPPSVERPRLPSGMSCTTNTNGLDCLFKY